MVKFHIEEKAIKHFLAEDFKKLDDYLLGWAKFTGITPAPDKKTRDMLIVFITKNFGYFTLHEMTNAFNMAIAGKLPIKDINNYNKLSGQWVSGILNAYQIERNKAMTKYNDEISRVTLIEKGERPESEQDAIMVDAIIRAYNNFLDNPDEEVIDLGNSMYNFLERKGIVNLSVSEKEDLLLIATNQVKMKLSAKKQSVSAVKAMGIQNLIDATIEGKGSEAQREAKRMVVQNAFYDLKNRNRTIEEYLKIADTQEDK